MFDYQLMGNSSLRLSFWGEGHGKAEYFNVFLARSC